MKELMDLVNLFFEVFSGAALIETKSHPLPIQPIKPAGG